MLRQELVIAWRDLRRGRPSAVALVVTMAIGIAVSVAAFTLVRDTVYRTGHAASTVGRVAVVRQGASAAQGRVVEAREFWSGPEIRAVFARAPGPFGVAYAPAAPTPVSRSGESLTLRIAHVSARFCAVLRPPLVRGHCDTTPAGDGWAGESTVVLSESAWRGHFDGAPDVVGKTIEVGGATHRVVAVAAASFTGPELRTADAWATTTASDMRYGGRGEFIDGHNAYPYLLLLVLRGGDVAEPELARIEAQLSAVGPSATAGASPRLTTLSLSEYRLLQLGRRGQLLTLVLAMAGSVLAMSASSVLLVWLSEQRRKAAEVGVRRALGASSRSLLLSALSRIAALGAPAMVAGLSGGIVLRTLAAPAILQTAALPATHTRYADVAWSAGAMLVVYVALASLCTFVGLRGRTERPGVAIQGLSHGRGAGRWSRTVVAAQIVVTVPLLFASLVFLQSLRAISAIDFGYDPTNVITVSILPALRSPSRPEVERMREGQMAVVDVRGLARALATEMSSRYGVPTGIMSSLPLTDAEMVKVAVPGVDQVAPHAGGGPDYIASSPEALHVLRIARRAGAELPARATGGEPVAVVNESMARVLWPSRSPIGQCLDVGPPPLLCHRIVGIVADTRRLELLAPPPMQFVVPIDDARLPVTRAHIVARVENGALRAQMMREVDSLARVSMPTTHEHRVRALEAPMHDQLVIWRGGARVASGVAAVALLVALVGLYSTAYVSMTGRLREMAIRQALGATPTGIHLLFARDMLVTVVAALAASVPLVLASRVWLDGVAYGTETLTVLHAALVLGTIVSAAALALVGPGRALRRVRFQELLDRG